MITNVLLHLLSHPDQLSLVLDDPGLGGWCFSRVAVQLVS
jgi:cytochrome P450